MTTKKESMMRIWDAVCVTQHGAAKKVEYGRKFTAIRPYTQFRAATEQFGPVGEGWGWDKPDMHLVGSDGNALVVCEVALWWRDGTGEKRYVPCVGATRLWLTSKNEPTKPDEDAHKKVLTDALTKGLSYLGFNADIFLGRWDDNKYVAEREREEAEANKPAPEPLDKTKMLLAFKKRSEELAIEAVAVREGIWPKPVNCVKNLLDRQVEYWALDHDGVEPSDEDWRAWYRKANAEGWWKTLIARIVADAAPVDEQRGEEF